MVNSITRYDTIRTHLDLVKIAFEECFDHSEIVVVNKIYFPCWNFQIKEHFRTVSDCAIVSPRFLHCKIYDSKEKKGKVCPRDPVSIHLWTAAGPKKR